MAPERVAVLFCRATPQSLLRLLTDAAFKQFRGLHLELLGG